MMTHGIINSVIISILFIYITTYIVVIDKITKDNIRMLKDLNRVKKLPAYTQKIPVICPKPSNPNGYIMYDANKVSTSKVKQVLNNLQYSDKRNIIIK